MGLDAFHIGLIFLIASLCFACLSPVLGWIADKTVSMRTFISSEPITSQLNYHTRDSGSGFCKKNTQKLTVRWKSIMKSFYSNDNVYLNDYKEIIESDLARAFYKASVCLLV